MGHRLMFSVVVLCVSAYLTYAEECLAGMQKRGDICCKPVTCKKNEDYRLCNHTHREDSCVPCPSNTFNQHSFDTSHQYYYEKQPNICKNHEEICVKTACPEEAKIVNHTECLRTGNVTCECDLSREFCGKDPITCEKWTGNVKELKKGIELTLDCEPMKCKPGLFKDVEGNEKCLEHRECSNGEIIIFNGTSTMNTQCGLPNAFESSAGHVWIRVIGVILGFAVLIGIVIVIFWKQRGRDNHRNANSGDLGQNVQDMTERETMMPNGDHVA